MKQYINIFILALVLFSSCNAKNKNLKILTELSTRKYSTHIEPVNMCQCLVTEYGGEIVDTIITKINFKYLKDVKLKIFEKEKSIISYQTFTQPEGIEIVKIITKSQELNSDLISKIHKAKTRISIDHKKEGKEKAIDFVKKIRIIAKNCGAKIKQEKK